MDVSTNSVDLPESIDDETSQLLSYDETVPYEEQLPSAAEAAALASRIGSTKVYLLSESSASAARGGKVRWYRLHQEKMNLVFFFRSLLVLF